MAGQRRPQRSAWLPIAQAHRHRLVGAGTAVGAFLAFGVTPPAAHADEFDLMVDQLINSVAALFNTDPGAATSDPIVWSAASSDVWFDELIYQPLHALEQDGLLRAQRR